jgi:hypothetical protein
MTDLVLTPIVRHISVTVRMIIKAEIAGQLVSTTIDGAPQFACEVEPSKVYEFFTAMQKLLREYDDEIQF